VATFVLIHAAWSSGWHWRKLVPLLRAAGHDVFAPTLTGLGERAHLVSPQVGLDTHVQDVVGLAEFEDLRDVVLVAHSYGGAVITAAADRIPERLAHLVYLDANAPRDGEHCGLDAARSPQIAQATAHGYGWLVPPPGIDGFRHYIERGELAETEVREMVARFRPQPLKTFTDPTRLANPAAAAVARTHVECTVGKPAEGSLAARRAKEAGWRYRELAAAHMAPFTHPRDVADLLLEVA
jgi:pimeloyl-ACP methyl ester carboxylesterase